MSNSLWPHGLQHTRLPCPSLSPGVCWNSCPLSWWCYLTISSSATPFSSCPQSFPTSGSFPMSWLLTSGEAKVMELQCHDFGHSLCGWIQERTKCHLSMQTNRWMEVYSFPIAAVTNYHRPRGLKQRGLTTLTVLGLQCVKWVLLSWHWGVNRAAFLPEALEENPFLCHVKHLEAACVPWLKVPSFVIRATSVALWPSCFFFHYESACGYLRPT